MNDDGPQTLIEAVQHFADPQVCHRYMVRLMPFKSNRTTIDTGALAGERRWR